MTNTPAMMRGIVHGKMIEMEGDLNLPEGQQVTVFVQPVHSPEEAIRQSAGGWADDPEGVDRFVEEMRRFRNLERPESIQ
jgi:hypothetical protein